jgi:hypothetical protein
LGEFLLNYVSGLLLTLGLLFAAGGPEASEPAAPGQSWSDTSEEEARKPNVIRWSTASEHDSFGYDIYRGLSEDGPFSVINSEVIPGAGTTDMPNSYEFVDDAIEPGTIYWYYIESISLSGERKKITPVYPSKGKAAEPSVE